MRHSVPTCTAAPEGEPLTQVVRLLLGGGGDGSTAVTHSKGMANNSDNQSDTTAADDDYDAFKRARRQERRAAYTGASDALLASLPCADPRAAHFSSAAGDAPYPFTLHVAANGYTTKSSRHLQQKSTLNPKVFAAGTFGPPLGGAPEATASMASNGLFSQQETMPSAVPPNKPIEVKDKAVPAGGSDPFSGVSLFHNGRDSTIGNVERDVAATHAHLLLLQRARSGRANRGKVTSNRAGAGVAGGVGARGVSISMQQSPHRAFPSAAADASGIVHDTSGGGRVATSDIDNDDDAVEAAALSLSPLPRPQGRGDPSSFGTYAHNNIRSHQEEDASLFYGNVIGADSFVATPPRLDRTTAAAAVAASDGRRQHYHADIYSSLQKQEIAERAARGEQIRRAYFSDAAEEAARYVYAPPQPSHGDGEGYSSSVAAVVVGVGMMEAAEQQRVTLREAKDKAIASLLDETTARLASPDRKFVLATSKLNYRGGGGGGRIGFAGGDESAGASYVNDGALLAALSASASAPSPIRGVPDKEATASTAPLVPPPPPRPAIFDASGLVDDSVFAHIEKVLRSTTLQRSAEEGKENTCNGKAEGNAGASPPPPAHRPPPPPAAFMVSGENPANTNNLTQAINSSTYASSFAPPLPLPLPIVRETSASLQRCLSPSSAARLRSDRGGGGNLNAGRVQQQNRPSSTVVGTAGSPPRSSGGARGSNNSTVNVSHSPVALLAPPTRAPPPPPPPGDTSRQLRYSNSRDPTSANAAHSTATAAVTTNTNHHKRGGPSLLLGISKLRQHSTAYSLGAGSRSLTSGSGLLGASAGAGRAQVDLFSAAAAADDWGM